MHRVTVVGSGTEPAHRRTALAPGVLWTEPPSAADLDQHATVLAVEPDGVELYRGAGRR